LVYWPEREERFMKKIMFYLCLGIGFMYLGGTLYGLMALKEQGDDYRRCVVYWRHGEVDSARVEGVLFEIGHMDIYEKMYMPAWKRELLERTKLGDCINIKEE
jgi:hypothetical protein